jgi:hypothetical protein
MEKNYVSVEHFESEVLGLGVYVTLLPSPINVVFNFNDLCDMLDLKFQKRKRKLSEIDELHKHKLWFKNSDGMPSEETFITMPAVSKLLTDYGIDINAMLNRKFETENVVYQALQHFDKYDENKQEEYSLADQFILDALYCDSIIVNEANKNLVNLLRQNDTMESVLRHYPQMNYDEYKDDVFIKEFIEMFDNDDNSILEDKGGYILESTKKAILEAATKYNSKRTPEDEEIWRYL